MAKYIYKYEQRIDSSGRTYYVERKTGKRVAGSVVLAYKDQQDTRLREARSKGGKKSYNAKWTRNGKWLTNIEKAKVREALTLLYPQDQLNPNQYQKWAETADKEDYQKVLNYANKVPELPMLVLAEDEVKSGTEAELTVEQYVNIAKSVNAQCRINGKPVTYNEFLAYVKNSYQEDLKEEKAFRKRKGKDRKKKKESTTVYKVYVVIMVDNNFNLDYNDEWEFA